MSEVSHIGSENSSPEEEMLQRLVSGLKVPNSSLSKDEVWKKLTQTIDKAEQSNRFRIRLMYWSAAAIVLIAVVSGVLEWQFAMKSIEAPAGKIAYGILPDSSLYSLNAGSELKHREYSFSKHRIVKLSGEGFFDVKSGKGDFVVIAGKNTVRVIGTRFNVYYRSAQLNVECLSGEVQVKSNNVFEKNITAGKGITFSPGITEPKTFDIDTVKSASWLRGEHYFTETPLSQVFQEIERQFNMKIEPQSFDATQRFYSGYFTTESLTKALNLVCLPMGLTYETNQKTRVVKISQHK